MQDTIFKTKILGFVFDYNPIYLALIFLIYAILLLVLCKKELRSIVIKEKRRTINVGYYYSYNWSTTFILVIPLLIYHIGLFFKEIPISIHGLVSTNVISLQSQSTNALNFDKILLDNLKANEGSVLIILLFISIIINIYDFLSYFLKKR